MELNQIICADCIDYMRTLPDDFIDIIITSPPYACQRNKTYGGINSDEFPYWFSTIGQEIHRVLKPTGSFVLNIKEHVENGVLSNYVEDTIKELRTIFRLSDTYIWVKTNPFPTGSSRRLKNGFEYCYWFTKTDKYLFFPNNVLVPSTSKYLESEKRRKNKGAHNCTNDSGMDMSKRYISDYVRASNVLTFPVDTTNHKHPAVFPKQLPEFFIKLMTEPDAIVFDPFCGSGTTCLVAKELGRNYLGCDIMQEYVDIARERIK